jgi:predicted PurR-regulated permease PerM
MQHTMNDNPNKTKPRLVTKDGWLSHSGALNLVLIALTALAFYICYQLLYAFIPSLTWALTLAVAAAPLHDRLLQRLKHPSIAAGLAVIIITFGIVGPGAFVGQSMLTEATRGVGILRKHIQSEEWRTAIESKPQLKRALGWIQPHIDVRAAAEQATNAAASGLSSLVGESIWILAQLLITLFTIFYFFRDRLTILKTVRSLIPLSDPDTDRLFMRISKTIYATIYGTFTVALTQGILGGLMFWWLGLPGAMLWGMVMALLALIPVLGAPVVWIPAAVFLFLMGSWGKALILIAWGVIVIGVIDNLLYPILVGDKMRMHTLLIFFSVVGGLFMFGSSGLILGPVSIAVTGMFLEVWKNRTSDNETREETAW